MHNISEEQRPHDFMMRALIWLCMVQFRAFQFGAVQIRLHT